MTSPARPEPTRTRVLIIDDDRKLCRLIKTYLEPVGYAVTAAHTGPEGLELAQTAAFDAIILDGMLPGLDGFEVLKELRKTHETPLLMLTARGDEADRIVGLELGADDYLPKTFSTRELLARLRAVTRRRTRIDDTPCAELAVGALHINLDARIAMLDGAPLPLTPVEFDFLALLAKTPGRIRTRDQLLEEIRDRNYEVFDRSVDVHISALRKKLNDDPKQPRFIQTVRSAGYMLLRPAS